jgi:hypothetical protein
MARVAGGIQRSAENKRINSWGSAINSFDGTHAHMIAARVRVGRPIMKCDLFVDFEPRFLVTRSMCALFARAALGP